MENETIPKPATPPDRPLFLELKKLLRLSGVYAAGDALTLGIGLILLPLYTAYLSPEEYGILSVALVIGAVAGILLTLGLNGSALKFYFDLEGNERKRFYGSLFLFLVLVPGLVLVFLEIFGERLFGVFLVQVPYRPYISLALWTAYVSVAFTVLAKEVLRASERAAAYAGLNAGTLLLTLGLTAWLVAGLHLKAEGALWARLITAAAMGALVFAMLRRSVRLSLDAILLKKALLYSLPLLPHFLSRWALHASDRVILERYVSLSDVGIYSVGYQIGSVVSMVAVAGNNSLVPLFGRLEIGNRKSVETLMRLTTYFILGTTAVGLGIALFSPELIRLLIPMEYGDAARVIPWVVLGYLFMTLYIPPMNSITLVAGDTKWVGLCTIGAACLNVGLNVWLIPIFGMIAAAITTAGTYLVLLIAVFSFARKKQPLPFEYRRIATVLAAGLASFFAGWSLAPGPGWTGALVKGGALAVFPAVLWMGGFFNDRERNAILKRGERFAKP